MPLPYTTARERARETGREGGEGGRERGRERGREGGRESARETGREGGEGGRERGREGERACKSMTKTRYALRMQNARASCSSSSFSSSSTSLTICLGLSLALSFFLSPPLCKSHAHTPAPNEAIESRRFTNPHTPQIASMPSLDPHPLCSFGSTLASALWCWRTCV